MEERRERWWSKHKSAEEARGCGGEWRGRSAIRPARKSKRRRRWRGVTRADLYWSPQTASLSALTGHKVNSQTTSFGARRALCARVYVCVRTWWITLKVDIASACQTDAFNPVRLDFHPSGIPRRDANQTSIPKLLTQGAILQSNYSNSILVKFFCPDLQQLYVDATPRCFTTAST